MKAASSPSEIELTSIWIWKRKSINFFLMIKVFVHSLINVTRLPEVLAVLMQLMNGWGELLTNLIDKIAKTIKHTEEKCVKYTSQTWCNPRYGHRRVARMCSHTSGYNPSHTSHTHTLKQRKNYVNAWLYIYSAVLGNRKYRGKNRLLTTEEIFSTWQLVAC